MSDEYKPELAALANIGDTLINMLTDVINELRSMNTKMANLKQAPTSSGYSGGGGGGYRGGGQQQHVTNEPIVSEVAMVEDKGTRARIRLVEGNKWVSTFDRAIIDLALEANQQGFPIEVTLTQSGQYVNIKTAKPAF